MKKLIASIVLLCAPLFANAASFDCKKATTSVEKTICEDKVIGKLDENIDYLYKQAKKTTKSVDALVASQRAWIKQRNQATSVEQLEDLHLVRQQQLLIIADPSASVETEQAMKRQTSETVAMERQAWNAPDKLEPYEIARLEKMAAEDGKVPEQIPVKDAYNLSYDDWQAVFESLEKHDMIYDDNVQISAVHIDNTKPEWLRQCALEVGKMEVGEFEKSAANAGVMEQFTRHRDELNIVRANTTLIELDSKLKPGQKLTPDFCKVLKATAEIMVKS